MSTALSNKEVQHVKSKDQIKDLNSLDWCKKTTTPHNPYPISKPNPPTKDSKSPYLLYDQTKETTLKIKHGRMRKRKGGDRLRQPIMPNLQSTYISIHLYLSHM